jgi:queuine tRNA-ribosyltransferase
MRPSVFRSKSGNIVLPTFFPDATRAVLRSLDSQDILHTQTPGILVNTLHLYRDLGPELLRTHGGIRTFMNWNGGVISDSGGFQVMSIAKKNGGMSRVTDEGVSFVLDHKTTLLTPELSVQMQFAIGADMMVVLDDFTPPDAS